MNFAIDTNRLSDYFTAKDNSLREVFRAAETIYAPVIVVGEYRFGAYRGLKRAYNLQNLENFLLLDSVTVLSIDQETASQYAELRAYLATNGTPIPVNDLWIAALCVQHDLSLLTRDSDFKHLPQVHLI